MDATSRESRAVRVMLCLWLALIPTANTGCELETPSEPRPGQPSDPPGGGNQPNRAPMSRIVLPVTGVTDTDIEVENLASDPDGDAITAYRFRAGTQDVTQTSSILRMRFADAGDVRVYVSAKDSKNLWGSEVSATLAVTNPPNQPRIIFTDDGTREPIDLGYVTNYPRSGQFSITTANGIRTMSQREGTGGGSYARNLYTAVPRGTHMRFRMRVTVDIDEPWATVPTDYGYGYLDLNFGKDGRGFGANYFVLGRNNLLIEGFPGEPPKLENYFTPGKHVFDRIPLDEWIVRDIDLDQLVATRFNANLNLGTFNQLAWFFTVRDVRNRGENYRLKLELDYFELYVPAR